MVEILGYTARHRDERRRDSAPKEEHRLYMAMQMSLEESRAVRFTSSGFQRAERAELGKTKASWNCQCMQVIIEESHICFLHWTQKAITIFPISLLGEGPEEGKTVPVPPVRFCIRFQRFTVPTVRKLFDFLRFGSTVPVRFQNLHAYMNRRIAWGCVGSSAPFRRCMFVCLTDRDLNI